MRVEKIELGELKANCYFLTVGGESAIIDPGADEPILREKLNREYKNVRFILLTHRHADHLMGTAIAKSLTSAEVLISKPDAVGLSDPHASLATEISFTPQQCLTPDRLLNDGDTIYLGGEELRVIRTPGHTIGGVCYCIGNALFTGDTLFKENCGRCDLPTGDYAAMLRSLSMLSRLDGDYTVYPGHGDTTTLEHERNHNPYMR